MKRIFLLILSITVLIACEDKEHYTLTGSAPGFENGSKIMVFNIKDNQPVVIDTLEVQNEKFTATYSNLTESNLYFLRPEGTDGTVIFFPESEDLNATIYKDSIFSSYVSGSKENEEYTSFAKKMFAFNTQRQNNMERFRAARQSQDTVQIQSIQDENSQIMKDEDDFKRQYVKENNNSIFSVMLLMEMVNRQEVTPKEGKEYLDNLTPRMAATDLAKELNKQLEKIKAAEVGNKAPDFSAPTPSGEEMSLKDALGKYTIIDFWASWCKPCRVENPNVVNVYKKYHGKGLNIISVSLDRPDQKDLWIKAIKDDNMDWYHVSNLQFWQDPIAAQYNVRAIPATFLLDESGNIIDKNLRGPALEEKIASLLGADQAQN